MSKPQTKSRAAKIREILRISPSLTADELVSKFKMTKQAAHVQLAVQRKTMGIVKTKDGKYVFDTPLFDTPLSTPMREKISTPARAGSLVRTDDAPRIVAEHFGVDKGDPVNHPEHYKVGGIETIDFIEAKSLSYNLGNVVKYLTRADHKGNKLQDLQKAQWYLNREIENTSMKKATAFFDANPA